MLLIVNYKPSKILKWIQADLKLIYLKFESFPSTDILLWYSSFYNFLKRIKILKKKLCQN